MNAKKILVAVLAVIMIISMVSCVGGPSNSSTSDVPPELTGTSSGKLDYDDVDSSALVIDLEDVVSHIAGNLTFDETPVDVMDTEIAEITYDIAGMYSEMYVVSSSMATAECVGYFKATDADNAAAIASKLKAYCDDMAVVYSSYNAEAADKLSKAMIEVTGNYVLMCVSPSSSSAKAVYQSYIVSLAEAQK